MVLRPLLTEVMSDSVRPALLAPNAATPVTANAADIQLVTRRTGTTLHVIAVRPTSTTTGKVVFSGLPSTAGGAPLSTGEVMMEYAQRPLPPPVDPTKELFRVVPAANGSFEDWFGPHDAHVYRFNLA